MSRFAHAFGMAWFILLTVHVMAWGQEATTTDAHRSPDVASRMAALESELATLKTRLDSPCAAVEPSCVTACGGMYAGFAFVFAKPHYKESFEATSVTAAGTTMDLLPFSFGYELAPRVWLGYEGSEGLGVRASYWQFDHSAHPLSVSPALGDAATAQVVNVIFPATITAAFPGDVLTVDNRLQLQTLDLEATGRTEVGGFGVLGGAGLRYARLEQTTAAAVTNGHAVTQQLDWSRRFEGVGPTLSAELRRSLGLWGIDFIGCGRGAVLFGNKDLSRLVSPANPGYPQQVSIHDASDVTGMGMAELGFEWNRCLDRYGKLFVRGTYEGQLWTDAGSPTLTFLGFEGFGLTLGLSR